MARVSRDPFAQTELHKSVVSDANTSRTGCTWCGGFNAKGKLYRFHTESDAGRKSEHSGSFCSVSCFRSYHQ